MSRLNTTIRANKVSTIFRGAGRDGTSAYGVAVRNGFVGTEQQWLESLQGGPGEQGVPGPNIINSNTSTPFTGPLVGDSGTVREALPGEVIDSAELAAAIETFEAYRNNHFSLPITNTTSTGDRLDSVTYGSGPTAYTKTLGYTGDKITTITLSGAIPSGIPTVKTITYTGDNITGTSYA